MDDKDAFLSRPGHQVVDVGDDIVAFKYLFNGAMQYPAFGKEVVVVIDQYDSGSLDSLMLSSSVVAALARVTPITHSGAAVAPRSARNRARHARFTVALKARIDIIGMQTSLKSTHQ